MLVIGLRVRIRYRPLPIFLELQIRSFDHHSYRALEFSLGQIYYTYMSVRAISIIAANVQ